ncbi:MAG: DUF3800 domain-containing protein [Planctomycetota bacterium]
MPTIKQASEVPCYVIYCDESCHDLTAHHNFMAIGGLKVPRAEKPQLSHDLRKLMQSRGLNSELKWSKVSAKRSEDYKRIVDFFFEHTQIDFRAIVVEQAKVRLEQYHGMDRELAFYKFYYEMLEKWLLPRNDYLILIDYKSNRGADRYTMLRKCLENALKGMARIRDLTIIDSSKTPLAQLCDILTGAVAAAYNGLKANSPKENLAKHIASRAHLKTLRTSAPLPGGKFNIFKMNLR